MYHTIPSCIAVEAVLKYRVTAAHFTPIGQQCSKIALTRSFYTSSVAIAVRKLVGAEHEDVVTYEKSSEWLARPFAPALHRGCIVDEEMLRHTLRLKTTSPDFHTIPVIWGSLTSEEIVSDILHHRQLWKSLNFIENYSGGIDELRKMVRPMHSYRNFDYGSLERRVESFIGSSYI